MFRRKSKQQHTDVKVSSGGGSGLFSRKQATRRSGKGDELEHVEVVTASDGSYETHDPIEPKEKPKHRSSKHRNNEKHLLENWFGKHAKEHHESKLKKGMNKDTDDSSMSSFYSRDEFFAKLDELESKSLHTSSATKKRGGRILTDADASRLDICQLINRREWKRAMARLKEKPSEARKTKKMSFKGMGVTTALPLHLAVTKKPPSDFVEELIRAYPAGPKQPDKQWKRLPIHIACMYGSGAHVLQVLLNAHKLSLRVLDQAEGRVPLHYVCLYGSPYEISLLMNAQKQALRVKDSQGKSPVDLARENPNQHRETIVRRLENTLRQMDAASNLSSSNSSRGSRRGSKSKHRTSIASRVQPGPSPDSDVPEQVSPTNTSPSAGVSSIPMGTSFNDFNASLNFEELRHPAYRETSSHFGSSVPAMAFSPPSPPSNSSYSELSRSITFHSTENAVDMNQCEHNRSITFNDEMLARSLQASLNERQHRSITFDDEIQPEPRPETQHEEQLLEKDDKEELSALKISSLDKFFLNASQSAAEVESHMESKLEDHTSIQASVDTHVISNKSKTLPLEDKPEGDKSNEDGQDSFSLLETAYALPQITDPPKAPILLNEQPVFTNDDIQSEPPKESPPSVTKKAIKLSQSESARSMPKNTDLSRSESAKGKRHSHQMNLLDDDDDMQPRSQRRAPPANYKKPPPKKKHGARGGRTLVKKGSKDDLYVKNRGKGASSSSNRRVKSTPRSNSYDYDSPSKLGKSWQEVATGSSDVPTLSTSSHHRSLNHLMIDVPHPEEETEDATDDDVHPLQNSKSLLGSLRGMGSDASSRDLIKEGSFSDGHFQSVDSLMKVVEEQENALKEKESEISQLETHLKNLDLRREALSQECEYVRKNAQEKEDIAEASRHKVAQMEQKLREMRLEMEKEKAALEIAESSEKVQKETLKEHVSRISATHTEKEVLLTIKENLLQERAEMTRKLINTRNEIKSIREIQNMGALA